MSACVALRGEAELAVYIDQKSPYAFVALEPTRRVARRAGARIDWRPFTLDIPSCLGSARRPISAGSSCARETVTD
ncbi:MAG TPA: hypothetical protein ENO23_10470 [Alphaproteobacteria bacterium]|nr:hypothetical protein [Alphaproteobacteria bacterium]